MNLSVEVFITKLQISMTELDTSEYCS
uniref:Uncharacterized protein n=1 Tax=Anguilla anguilla TaxID=7936 RepID=A0A0E9PM74_ANGAN